MILFSFIMEPSRKPIKLRSTVREPEALTELQDQGRAVSKKRSGRE